MNDDENIEEESEEEPLFVKNFNSLVEELTREYHREQERFCYE